MLNIRRLCAAMGLLWVAASVSWAQGLPSSINQTFEMKVPVSLSIEVPVSNVSVTHNTSNANQDFPVQVWNVAGNPGAGMAVSFSTTTPFVHTGNNAFKADAKLALTIGATTGSTFTVTAASDTTNYIANDNTALVTATSNGPGTAQLNLAVSFVTSNFNLLGAGTYRTIVTGTIASN